MRQFRPPGATCFWGLGTIAGIAIVFGGLIIIRYGLILLANFMVGGGFVLLVVCLFFCTSSYERRKKGRL